MARCVVGMKLTATRSLRFCKFTILPWETFRFCTFLASFPVALVTKSYVNTICKGEIGILLLVTYRYFSTNETICFLSVVQPSNPKNHVFFSFHRLSAWASFWKFKINHFEMYDYKVIFLPSIIKQSNPTQFRLCKTIQTMASVELSFKTITQSNNVANCQHLFAYLNY